MAFTWPPRRKGRCTRSVSAEAPLVNPDPAAYLPHRFPFLMLDRLLELEPGVSARGEKRVTASLGGFPHVLLVECIAQLAGIAAVREEGEGGFLATIDCAQFQGEVQEGDTLLVSARIVKSFGRLCLVEGRVDAGGRCLVEAQLTLGIGKL